MGWDGMSNLNYYCLSDEFLLQKDKRKKMMGLSCPSPDCSSSSPRYNLFSLFTFLLPKGFIFLVLMRMGFGYRNSEKQSVIVASPSRFSCYSEPVNFIPLFKKQTFWRLS